MEARLQPCNDEYQSCQRYRLVVSPKSLIEEYNTFSDIHVQYWTLLKASEVQIMSESVVDVRERPLTPIDVPPVELDPLEFYAYLHDTPLTEVTPEIHDFAAQFEAIAAENWYQAVLAVREAIHDAIDFQSGQTTTDTTATEVLQLRCGVCQDFTHLMIAALRCLGIPARYTSGYLNQNVSQKPRQSQSMSAGVMWQEQISFEAILEDEHPWRGTGASHAWVEAYFGPEHGWRGFDAANNLLVDQNFIRIGAGRDYRDVTPVKGVHKGPAEEDLTVTVNVTRIT
jgi:transglutaminase-like putative cysteine protease